MDSKAITRELEQGWTTTRSAVCTMSAMGMHARCARPTCTCPCHRA